MMEYTYKLYDKYTMEDLRKKRDGLKKSINNRIQRISLMKAKLDNTHKDLDLVMEIIEIRKKERASGQPG